MSETLPRLNAALDGRYRIERVIGQGGMATVYLAHDLRHDRPVAVKILRPDLAAVMGADRFLSEIRTTANLQHPHILPLHDSGDADGFLFYVMPYVEGESMRALLDREKQLGVDEALRITKQVGSALDYAHRQGVIHRDIKPENVLMHDGQPLVADFGIALAVTAAGAGRLTETGLSLGTPYYMSPEQATADRDPGPQSDVYSLACMLYEMLVGDPPHTGSSAQAVLAKILTERPRPITQLRETVPAHVGAAVAKALERLPADRFDTTDAFIKALDDAGFTHATVARTAAVAAQPAPAKPIKRWLSALPWGIAAVATGVAIWALGPEPPPPTVTRVTLATLEGQEYTEAQNNPTLQATALSPDGTQLVYIGLDPDDAGRPILWRRRLDALEATPIAGTEHSWAPAFSKDGSQLAFVSQANMLSVIPQAGGTPLTIENGGRVSAWGDDGALYAGEGRSGEPRIVRWVPGAAEWEPVAEISETFGLAFISDVLPGSRAVLMGGQVLTAVDLTTGEVHPLGQGRRPRYLSSGHIVYMREEDNTLLVQPFDVASLSTTGPAVATSATVTAAGASGAEYDVAADGTLVYASGAPGGGRELVWVDRNGAIEPIDWIEPGTYDGIALSPDGMRVAAGWSAGSEPDIWVFDLAGRFALPLTRDGRSNRPQWHPDGTRISYNGPSADGTNGVMSILADGSGTPEHILDMPASGPRDAWWTADGRELLLRRSGASLRSIFRFVPGESEAPEPWLDRAFQERNPAPSPDGHWLLYTSDQSGRDEVLAQPYPERGPVVPVSNEGGRSAVWSRDGREVFWQGDDGFLWAAEVTYDESTFTVESRARLFELGDLGTDVHRPLWAVAPDGRFLFTRGTGGFSGGQLVLVRNWVQEVTGGR